MGRHHRLGTGADGHRGRASLADEQPPVRHLARGQLHVGYGLLHRIRTHVPEQHPAEGERHGGQGQRVGSGPRNRPHPPGGHQLAGKHGIVEQPVLQLCALPPGEILLKGKRAGRPGGFALRIPQSLVQHGRCHPPGRGHGDTHAHELAALELLPPLRTQEGFLADAVQAAACRPHRGE